MRIRMCVSTHPHVIITYRSRNTNTYLVSGDEYNSSPVGWVEKALPIFAEDRQVVVVNESTPTTL